MASGCYSKCASQTSAVIIEAVALPGWSLAKVTLAGSGPLRAAISPIDPVLVADMRVGKLLEGNENRVRFTLTIQAGLNEGLAFPIVYLGLILVAQSAEVSAKLIDPVLRDVPYRIAVGVGVGALDCWVLGLSQFSTWASSAV